MYHSFLLPAASPPALRYCEIWPNVGSLTLGLGAATAPAAAAAAAAATAVAGM